MAKDLIGRIPCEVPFCRRTYKPEKPGEPERVICGKHWRLGDRRSRRVFRIAKRKFEATGDLRYRIIAVRCWNRVRRQAIERAGGI